MGEANNIRYDVDNRVDWENQSITSTIAQTSSKSKHPGITSCPKTIHEWRPLGATHHATQSKPREDASWTTAIHEMAHIIQFCHQERWEKFSVEYQENDWSPHGSIFCGILAILYEEFGLWPVDKEHLTTVEINEGHQDPDFYYMRRHELWDMGIMLPKDLSFEANMTNWLKQHNRIGRINRAIGTEAQRFFGNDVAAKEEDPLWAKAENWVQLNHVTCLETK